MSSESSPNLETAECNRLLDTLLNNASTNPTFVYSEVSRRLPGPSI
jgi:hypothetical protein